MIAEFRAFREREGLPFDPALVPHRFDDPKDLEFGYWQIEDAVKAAQDVPPPPPPPVPTYSQKQVDRKFDLMLETVGKWVGLRIAEALKASVEPMRARIAELEAKEFRFLGQWCEGVQARAGQAVAFDGSTWIAIETTRKRPGTENSGWVLAAKRGRDGRDKGASR